jgi:hypothetical protein
MAASAIACPGCGDAVPYGRLSCPSCGELLALVAGGSRRPAAPERTLDPPVVPAWDPQPATASTSAASAPTHEPDPEQQAWPTAPMPASLLPLGTDPTAPVQHRDPGNGWDEPAATAATDAPLAWAPAREPDDETPLLEPEPEPYPIRPVPPRWGAAAAAPPPASVDPGTASWPAGSAGPAAAQPSWPVPAPEASWPAPAAEPAWPARPTPGSAFEAGPPIAPTGAYPPGSSFAASGAARADAPVRSATPAVAARGLPELRLDELWTSAFQERVIVIGGAIATIAFFLPWASAVIGTPPLPDPWDSFGIVGAWHLIPFLLTVGTVALSQFGARFPAWFRLGLAPLATAGLLLGLDWYYLVTPLGGWLGGYVLAAGALVMGTGGVLAIRSLGGQRNAEVPPSV